MFGRLLRSLSSRTDSVPSPEPVQVSPTVPVATTGSGPEITLRFRAAGAPYQRALAVAERIGVSIDDYLLLCISEGHQVLANRVDPGGALDREPETEPAPTVKASQDLYAIRTPRQSLNEDELKIPSYMRKSAAQK